MSSPNPPSNNSRALVPVNTTDQALIPNQPQRIFPPKVIVTFINTSNTTVNVRWLNTDNTYKDYGDLKAQSYRSVITFYGHRWTFHDINDGELFTTNYNSEDDEEIYFAAKLPEDYKRGEESPKIHLTIHRRMQSLAYLALKSVARRPDLRDLQLPPKVKEALISYGESRRTFLQQRRRDKGLRISRPA